MQAERGTLQGKLKGWWSGKYGGKANEDFENRTLGGLIREYYEEAAIELARLRATLRAEGHDADLEARMSDLETLFSDYETDLRALSDEESLDEWHRPRKTGDPEVDEWEAAIARGETPNLED